ARWGSGRATRCSDDRRDERRCFASRGAQRRGRCTCDVQISRSARNDMSEYQTSAYDVLVIGAGGAGLRAAIEAAAHGARVGLICKSRVGKGRTVMSEGGAAAAKGHV